MLRRDGYVIWTLYFDAGLSRSEGRRVPERLAVKNPSQELLLKAVQRLGWHGEPLDKKHPSRWWRAGASLIVKPPRGVKKSRAIKMIAESLRERH